jgi:hypothetical protein
MIRFQISFFCTEYLFHFPNPNLSMVWIQAWTDPHEFIHAKKIESIYYRPVTVGDREDTIEIIARPHEKVLLQISVNAGNLPTAPNDQKAWQKLVDARALLAVSEVIRVISDPELRSQVIQLKDYIAPEFGEDAPLSLDIEVWVWEIPCQNCHQKTPVVYPVGAFFGYMLEFNFLSRLPILLAGQFPFFKKGPAKGKDGEEYRNTCTHCGEPQPDFRVMESYLELVNKPDIVQKKMKITVPLTDKERIEYQRAGMASTW